MVKRRKKFQSFRLNFKRILRTLKDIMPSLYKNKEYKRDLLLLRQNHDKSLKWSAASYFLSNLTSQGVINEKGPSYQL